VEESERERLHRIALDLAQRDADSAIQGDPQSDRFVFENLRLTDERLVVVRGCGSFSEMYDLAVDALDLVRKGPRDATAPVRMTCAVVERLAAVAYREARRARLFAAAYVEFALGNGVLDQKWASQFRAEPERALYSKGVAGGVVHYFYYWGPTDEQWAIVRRLPSDLVGFEPRHLSAAMALVWIDRAMSAARAGRAVDAAQLAAASGVALVVPNMDATSIAESARARLIRRETAKRAADSLHEPMRAVRSMIVERYRAGNYRSANQAAFDLAPLAIEHSRHCVKPLSPFNAQKTVHGWLLAASKTEV
jgi:hypothetical protein